MGIEDQKQEPSTMGSMNLKDFRNDPSTLLESDEDTDSIASLEYHRDVNTLRIEKLSNRVTLISVILPCLICAILVFAYLDMKERVVDVDTTKKLQVEKIAQQLEEKFNSLDLRIAKIKFDFDQQLPLMTKKEQELTNQVAKMSASKADAKTIQRALTALGKKVQKNTAQNKSTLAAIKASNLKLLAFITENNTQFKKNAGQIKSDITLFKEEFDARLLELSAYEEQIGQLRKNVSILNKKLKALELDGLSKNQLDKRFFKVQQSLEKMIQSLDKKLDKKIDQQTFVKPPSTNKADNLQNEQTPVVIKPVPQIDTGGVTQESISEKTLNQ
jgi:hypothetical protein